MTRPSYLFCLSLALAACQGKDRPRAGDTGAASAPLTGTSWQLVRFQSMNDWTFTPTDHARYTVAFEPDGRVSIRADCNRGSGTWSSPEANVLQFGPIASTKALCPPASLSEQFLRDFQYMRSYLLQDGLLHISLMADGGIYDFEPMEKPS